MISINWHPAEPALRWFAALWFPAFWGVVGLIVGLRTGRWNVVLGVFAAVAVMSIMGVVRPRLIRPVYVAWMLAAWPIGWLVSHLLLATVYFGIITPLGLLLRAAGRDKPKLQFDAHAATYWTRRPPPPPASRYFRQF